MGRPDLRHEAIAHRIADMAATTFAMDSISKLASAMADRGGYDIRLEARGEGVEHRPRLGDRRRHPADPGRARLRDERSLEGRGEFPIPVERVMRDIRINLIFEGSSEIMHLFMAREAVDKHLQVAGAMIDAKNGAGEKLRALRGSSPTTRSGTAALAAGAGRPAPLSRLGTARAAPALRRAQLPQARARELPRHDGLPGQDGAKQGFLFRCVDVVMELFAMAAVISRARQMVDDRDPEAERALALADLFCRTARRKVRRLFRDLWVNEDARKNQVAATVMQGEQVWLEKGAMDIGLTRRRSRPAPSWSGGPPRPGGTTRRRPTRSRSFRNTGGRRMAAKQHAPRDEELVRQVAEGSAAALVRGPGDARRRSDVRAAAGVTHAPARALFTGS